MNPFLGWRAIRFCLERTDIFLTQLRAILRASHMGNVKMMYPLISSKQEFCQANEILQIARQELEEQKKPFNDSMEVGAMIEVPSAALTANHIAEEADFFSIGTNDLIQYSLAVDRVNEKIAYLYDPAHPAILRLVAEIIQAGHNHGIEVGICGEMGGDVTLAPLLIGLGIDEISMNASSIPVVKKMVRSIARQECENFSREMLKLSSGEQIWEHSRQVVLAKAPELLELG
jgi:phosphotransferase system enzyme I (PtsI)